MKKVTGIDGGPRKSWNTSAMIRRALDGAESAGAETELFRLYDLNFKGCTSCFTCKQIAHYNEGKCAMQDELSPVLESVMGSDVVIMGSPVYFSDVTGAMRSFWERLLFMNLAYNDKKVNMSVCTKKISCGVLYTMNIPEDMLDEWGYTAMFESHARSLRVLNGEVEYLTACDTFQFDNYSRYYAPMFDVERKKRMRDVMFPLDCEHAYQMGARLTDKAGRAGHESPNVDPS
ncbi:MAG: flavodoxin family protein [Synergistaceae bacterium]|nr:flavodoxin family protein [Synergistaceae bacterium]